MAFSISAELPLGTYRGAGSDGRVDRLPSVARLHAALLCAAGVGPRARAQVDLLGPCEADEVALRWLEDNPPDQVAIPALQINQGAATAYRDDGTLKKSQGVYAIKTNGKSTGASVAVAGRFTWTWSCTPPAAVVDALRELCPDVSHLGTSESPVRLTTSLEAGSVTHELDPGAALFAGRGEDIEVPTSGRVDELLQAHRTATSEPPSLMSDRIVADEQSSSPTPPRTAVAAARYTPKERERADVPWPDVVLVPLDRGVPERLKVRWSVAVHRALIAAIGDGAPPVVTGVYPAGVARPTNRLALHLLDTESPTVPALPGPSTLAVLIPPGVAAGDLQVLLAAVGQLGSIRGPRGVQRRVTGVASSVSGAHFWASPPPGAVRLWRTSPPAVPDTRGADPTWTFSQAAMLSLGFVWQGSPLLPRQQGRGAARDRALSAAATGAGAAALRTEPLRTSDVHDYAHRVNEHAVVRPYRALLSTGDLGGEQAIQAIGQTRHLGGGLLVPVDVPVGTAVDDVPIGANASRHGAP